MNLDFSPWYSGASDSSVTQDFFANGDFVSNVDLSGLPNLNDIPGGDQNSPSECDNDASYNASHNAASHDDACDNNIFNNDASLERKMADPGHGGTLGLTPRPSEDQTCETGPSEAGAGGAFDELFDPYRDDFLDQVNLPPESGGPQFPGTGEYLGLSAPTAVFSHEDQAHYVDVAPRGLQDHQPTIPESSKMESSSASARVNQEYSREPVHTTQIPSNETTVGALVPPKIPHVIDGSTLPAKPAANMASGKGTTGTTNTPQSNPDEAEISLRFSSAVEANEYPARAFIGADPTIPTTQEQKEEYVRKLIRAMNSTDGAEDNEKVVQRFIVKKYCQIRMEIVSWNILDACISRHQYGPLLPGEKPKAPKNTEKIETFEARINTLLEIISSCKTIVQHLLEPYYMYAIIDDPDGARKRVRSNRALNKKKSEVMKFGKKAMEEQKATEDPSTSETGVHPTGKSKKNTPSTPGRGSDVGRSPSAQQPASTPVGGYGQGVHPNTGLVTPGTSSPYVAHPAVGPSEHTPHSNPYPTPNMGPLSDLPHNLPYPNNPQYGAQPTQSTQPYYPASGYVHQYNPARPSRLQNAVDPAIMGSQQTSTAMHPVTAQGGIQGNVGDVTAPYEQYLGSSGLTFQSNPDLKRPIGDLEGPNPTGGPDKKLRQ